MNLHGIVAAHDRIKLFAFGDCKPTVEQQETFAAPLYRLALAGIDALLYGDRVELQKLHDSCPFGHGNLLAPHWRQTGALIRKFGG